jgi:hypothetical protein
VWRKFLLTHLPLLAALALAGCSDNAGLHPPGDPDADPWIMLDSGAPRDGGPGSTQDATAIAPDATSFAPDAFGSDVSASDTGAEDATQADAQPCGLFGCPPDAGPRDAAGAPDSTVFGVDASTGGCSIPDTLTSFYGNGIGALTGNWSNGEIGVQLKGCGGSPVVGASVTWTVTLGTGEVADWGPPSMTVTTMSDAQGIARAHFRHPSEFGQVSTSNEPGMVHVTTGNLSIDIPAMTFNSCADVHCNTGALSPQILLRAPGTTPLTGSRGQMLAGAVIADVFNMTGQDFNRPVAGVGLYLAVPLDVNDPTTQWAPSLNAACVGPGGTALTDATGRATCDVQLGNTPGTFGVRFMVGEITYWEGTVIISP